MDNASPKQINWTMIIIVGILTLGAVGFYFANSLRDQNTIERERIESNERLKSEELRQKSEQGQSELMAQKKENCMSIYKTEGAKWNNVTGWRFSEESGTCYIEYKDSPQKTDEQCDDMWPLKDANGKTMFDFFHENSLCKNGRFENSF